MKKAQKKVNVKIYRLETYYSKLTVKFKNLGHDQIPKACNKLSLMRKLS